MVAAMTAFTVNDAFLKAISGDLPLLQILFVRGMGLVACLFVLCAALGQLRFRGSRRDLMLILLRSCAELAAAILFLSALFNMPFANVSAIMQAMPLTVSLAGAFLFGEVLGWRRLLAIAIGFGGVMMIVQPGGAQFSVYSFAVLGAVACVTVRDLAARRLSRDVPSVFVALVAAVFVTAGSGIGSTFVDWAPITPRSAVFLAASTVALLGGYVFSVATMRVGEVSFVAPFRYTSLLVALVLGYVVFSEAPNSLALGGATLVVGTGLFTLYREARLRQAR